MPKTPSLLNSHKELMKQINTDPEFSPPLNIEELVKKLPRPGPPLPQPPPSPLPPGSLTAEEVWSRWLAGGEEWLQGCSYRDRLAAVVAFQSSAWIAAMDEKLSLLDRLWPLLFDSQRKQLFSTVWFSFYPPRTNLVDLLSPLNWKPAWWDKITVTRSEGLTVDQPWFIEFLNSITTYEQGTPSIPYQRFEVAESLVLGPWLPPLIRAARPNTSDEFRRVLWLADGGLNCTQANRVTPATLEAVRSGIHLGTTSTTAELPESEKMLKTRIAQILKNRLGEIFGRTGGPGWKDLQSERSKVKSWLMHRVLEIVFFHLTPEGTNHEHQTKPRQIFWGTDEITAHIEKIYVIAGREFDAKLSSEEMGNIFERFKGAIERVSLEGHRNKALVCMHLTHNGKSLTIVEGNANCRIYIKPGIVDPPFSKSDSGRSYVDYNSDIINGEVLTSSAALIRTHHGDWQQSVRDCLRQFGIEVS